MFCFWERYSPLDIFHVTGCDNEISTDSEEITIKKCPFCNKKIIDINNIIDSFLNLFIKIGR